MNLGLQSPSKQQPESKLEGPRVPMRALHAEIRSGPWHPKVPKHYSERHSRSSTPSRVRAGSTAICDPPKKKTKGKNEKTSKYARDHVCTGTHPGDDVSWGLVVVQTFESLASFRPWSDIWTFLIPHFEELVPHPHPPSYSQLLPVTLSYKQPAL